MLKVRALSQCLLEIKQNRNNYLYSEVTSWVVHFRDGVPGISRRIIFFSRIHSGYSIEPSQCVYMVSIRNHSYATSAVAHRRNHRPLVGVWVVCLSVVQAFLAIESTTYINFTWYKRNKMTIKIKNAKFKHKYMVEKLLFKSMQSVKS